MDILRESISGTWSVVEEADAGKWEKPIKDTFQMSVAIQKKVCIATAKVVNANL